MAKSDVGVQKLAGRKLIAPIFMTGHGADSTGSVSASPSAKGGALYVQIPAGSIIGKWIGDNFYYRLAYGKTLEAMGAAGKTFKLASFDLEAFEVGDLVELPSSVAADTDRFRRVVSLDMEAETLTVDGADFTLAEGDEVEHDPTRSDTLISTTAPAPGGATTLQVDDASAFKVGDVIEAGASANLDVTAVDAEAAQNTITVSQDVAATEGDLVVSSRRGRYRITPDTTNTVNEQGVALPNVLVPYRDHGKVREKLLRGLTPSAKAELEAKLLTFSGRAVNR